MWCGIQRLTGEIMTEWLMTFDQRKGRSNRKVLFFGNGTSHFNDVLNEVITSFCAAKHVFSLQSLGSGHYLFKVD